MEKLFSLYNTLNLFEGSSEAIYRLVCKLEEVKAVIDEWKRRARSRAELARMNNHMLQDIGLNRHDVDCEINKPFWKE